MTARTRFLALLCALALALGLLLPLAVAAEDRVYFLAMNEQVPVMGGNTNPIVVGGTVYVPYTAFDSNYTDVDLGVIVAPSKGKVMLFALRRYLTFDTISNTCIDQSGEEKNYRAIVRNNRTYLPVSAVCGFFGLQYSYLPTEYGDVIRIKNSAVALSDDQFLDAAPPTLYARLREYQQSLIVQEPPAPSPTPSPTPTPTPPAPVVPGEPGQPNKSDVLVYLAFRCTTGEQLNTILDALDRENKKALFFFSPADLATRDDAVRRVIASGHCVGLIASGSDPAAAQAALAEGNRLLGHIARISTHSVLVESGEEAMKTALAAEGWICWRGNVDGIPRAGRTIASHAAAVLQSIAAKRTLARVLLDDSAVSSGALTRILTELKAQQYTLRLAIETELGN